MSSAGVKWALGLCAASAASSAVQIVIWGGPAGAFEVVPRSSGGWFPGAFLWPFAHFGWGHLAANLPALTALSLAVGVQGVRPLAWAWAAGSAGAGTLVWLLGGYGAHAGASGAIFGLFGFLVGSAFARFSWLGALCAAGAAAWFGASMLAGLVPVEGVSWSGHFFGLAAGGLGAKGWAWAQRRP